MPFMVRAEHTKHCMDVLQVKGTDAGSGSSDSLCNYRVEEQAFVFTY